MTWFDLIAIGVLGLGVVLWAAQVRSIWRNEWKWAKNPDLPRPGWLWGTALWRGTQRVFPMSGGALAMLVISFVALRLGSEDVMGVAGVLFALLFLSALSIILLNRPKLLVPPHLRHHPGAIAEWLGKPVAPTQPPPNPVRWETG
jgi:hypothetical protein